MVCHPYVLGLREQGQEEPGASGPGPGRLGDNIFRIVVPTEEEIEIRNGQRHTVQRKVYPGYVLIEMIMSDDAWYLVRNTPGRDRLCRHGQQAHRAGQGRSREILRQMEAEAPQRQGHVQPAARWSRSSTARSPTSRAAWTM